VVQGSAGTTEDAIKYSWNYALLPAEGRLQRDRDGQYAGPGRQRNERGPQSLDSPTTVMSTAEAVSVGNSLACARLVNVAAEQVRPKAILIEGPSDSMRA
jgi:hypothetical protein